MKPVDFVLHRPGSVREAVALLAEHGDKAKVLGGGQSLLPLMNFRLARPEHVVDLGRVADLRLLRRTADGLSIGAMVTHARGETSSAIAAVAPLLSQAFPNIAHPAIRARGTIGGSMAHADPAAELPAVAVALDATMVLTGPDGSRVIAAADFFLGNLITVLRPAEILTEIRVPSSSSSAAAAFEEVSRRRGDFALVGAGAQVCVDGSGAIEDVRICLTGVASVPYRATEAERALIGHPADPVTIETAADLTRASIQPSDDLHATADYRREVAGTLLTRVVNAAVARARPSTPPGRTPHALRTA